MGNFLLWFERAKGGNGGGLIWSQLKDVFVFSANILLGLPDYDATLWSSSILKYFKSCKNLGKEIFVCHKYKNN